MPAAPSPAAPVRRALAVAVLGSVLLVAQGCGDGGPGGAGAPGDGGNGPAPVGPHVVLVSIDTLRADHLGCYGYARQTSPFLDVLASQSALYERAHSHSNSTAPSHVTMLSGVLPPVHGVRHRSARGPSPQVPMLAELFAAAGWRTAAFTDGGYVTEPFGFARGFEVFDARLERFDAKLDRVESWLDAAEDRPTLLFVHTYGVHAPYLPAEEHDLFTDAAYDGPLAERVRALRGLVSAEGRWPPFEETKDAFWGDRSQFDARDRQHLVDLYDGCIHEVDAGLGRLLAALDRKGWLDTAWLVVTSDHGEAFGEHGTYGHRQLYQEELHVPLLVRPPGGVSGPVRVAETVGLAALAPTLLSLAGLEPPAAMTERPLVPVVAPGARPVHALAADAADFAAYLEGDGKLVTHGERHELYELAADPREARDRLAGTPDEAARQVADRLARALAASEAACRALRARLGEPVEESGLDAEQQEALSALGYVR